MENKEISLIFASVPNKKNLYKTAYWPRFKQFVAIKSFNQFENSYVIETIKGICFCVPEKQLTRFVL
jgi:hypothetical protein